MRKILFIVAISLVLFANCKKDEEQAIETSQLKMIEKLENLDVPEVMKSSSNEYAQQALGYVDEVKGMSSYFDYFDMPDNATHGNDGYMWDYGGMKIWESISDNSSSNMWDIDVDMGAGRTKYIHSEEKKDGSGGSLAVFDFTQKDGELIYTYNWSFDSNNNATLSYEFADESFKYEVKSNTDLSGSAITYINGEKLYSFIWNTDGSGSYEYYDESGNVIMSDSWTAADL